MRGAAVVAALALAIALGLWLWRPIYQFGKAKPGDLAGIAGSCLTGVGLLAAAWQFHRQRQEVSEEAYFSRLNLPNERRLGYYEQVVALGPRIGKLELAAALEQFYAFYMYAELDNLEYALTKYVEDQMAEELAVRAVKTFMSRCRQSIDFRELACTMVTKSGYPVPFEALVRDLVGPATRPHPMQRDELAVVRELRRPDA